MRDTEANKPDLDGSTEENKPDLVSVREVKIFYLVRGTENDKPGLMRDEQRLINLAQQNSGK